MVGGDTGRGYRGGWSGRGEGRAQTSWTDSKRHGPSISWNHCHLLADSWPALRPPNPPWKNVTMTAHSSTGVGATMGASGSGSGVPTQLSMP